tara:strand:+ start:576 stop:824 length:249 start_codon:yes stop_codon:yes gene_type:complete
MKDYAVIRMIDIDLIDFNEVGQTAKETVRKNLIQDKCIVKWNDTEVPTILKLNNITPLFVGNHTDISQYLVDNDAEWNEPII